MDVEHYVNTFEVLGRGAYKIVYKGIDRQKGIEVAWNELDVREVELSKVIQEIQILRTLDHDNVLRFHDSWLDEEHLKLIFITELMTSGSLRSFLKVAKFVSIRVIKTWCQQILFGLEYLHNLNIIHRDIKLDNIFKGEKGKVKIGDLGLATIMNQKDVPRSIIGTPEFMAPEFYDEKYDEKVDIWAFGMCIIEMITLEYPYKECTNVGSLYKTVSAGIMPQALALIKDPTVLEFICCCLEVDVKKRLTVKELLKHPFFDESKEEMEEDKFVELRSPQEVAEILALVGSPLTRLGWEAWIVKVITPVRESRARKSLDEARPSKELPDQEQEPVQPKSKNTLEEIPSVEIIPEAPIAISRKSDKRGSRRSLKSERDGNFSEEDEVLEDTEFHQDEEDVVLDDDVQSLIVSAPMRLPDRPLFEDDRILVDSEVDIFPPLRTVPSSVPTGGHLSLSLPTLIPTVSIPFTEVSSQSFEKTQPETVNINPLGIQLTYTDSIPTKKSDSHEILINPENSRNLGILPSPRVSPRGRSVSATPLFLNNYPVTQTVHHPASSSNGSIPINNRQHILSSGPSHTATVSKEDPPKKRKIDDLTSKNLLELQFTTTKTLKASKPEFPGEWLIDQRHINDTLTHSATVAQGTTTPPLATVINPFLDPTIVPVAVPVNPFLDRPSTISPRTINNLASLGSPSTTMPYHT